MERKRAFAPRPSRRQGATPVRLARLVAGLRIEQVAVEMGTTLARLSQLEREPQIARQGELDAYFAAIDRLTPPTASARG